MTPKDEEKDKPPASTNVLLKQILEVSEDTNATLKESQKIAVAQLALTQKLVDAIIGDFHNFTIKVEQIHKAVVKK